MHNSSASGTLKQQSLSKAAAVSTLPRKPSPKKMSFKSQKSQPTNSTITLLTPEANTLISQLQGTFERSMQQLQSQMRGIEQRVLKTNLELDSLSQSNIQEARERERERASLKEQQERELYEAEMRMAAAAEDAAKAAEIEAIMINLVEQQKQLDQVVQYT